MIPMPSGAGGRDLGRSCPGEGKLVLVRCAARVHVAIHAHGTGAARHIGTHHMLKFLNPKGSFHLFRHRLYLIALVDNMDVRIENPLRHQTIDEVEKRHAAVSDALLVDYSGDVMTVTENGFGKRTPIEQFPIKGRGGMGVISIKASDRNGEQVGAVRVDEDDEMMLITNGGTLVRTRVADVSQMGRDTQGVTMIRLSKDEKLIGIERIEALDAEDDDEVEDEVNGAGSDAD